MLFITKRSFESRLEFFTRGKRIAFLNSSGTCEDVIELFMEVSDSRNTEIGLGHFLQKSTGNKIFLLHHWLLERNSLK